MSDTHAILDGTGTFNAISNNAGTIKYGSFNNAATNTGAVAVSAIFTGTAVNHGIVGNILPIATATLVADSSAAWNNAYSTVNNLSATWSSGGGGSTDLSDINTAISNLSSAVDGKQASGDYATLESGKIPASQLPSYVDDVLEYAALANFPVMGSTGIIYVATGTNKTYRWSGSAYVEISPSPGSTDSVTEGSTNLYFTNARAIAATSSSYAATSHTHSISDVTGLQTTINDLSTSINAIGAPGDYAAVDDARLLLVGTNSGDWNSVYSSVAAASAGWSASGTEGSAQAGAVYSTVNSNSATWSTVTSKADTSHTHAISAVTNLQTSLDAKAASSHTHAISAVTNLQASLDAKAASSHTHAISDVTNLQTSLDAKAASSHTHTIANITNLQTSLDAKAASSHTHSASDITNFSSSVDARITAAAGVSVASLVSGTVPASQLPSYVDDVLEYAALANFPVMGSTGIIYVATGTNKTYRWSGSAYVEISPSPGSTDSVTEGSTNLYFTNARAIAATSSSYAATSHTHTSSQITDFNSSVDARMTVVNANSATWNTVTSKANTSHTHAISDVTNLQTSLDAKAASSHTHAISDVTNLQSSLDAKAGLGKITFAKTYLTSTGQTAFTITASNSTPASNSNYVVSLDGAMQVPDTDFTVSGSTLTFTTTVPSGVRMLVLALSSSI